MARLNIFIHLYNADLSVVCSVSSVAARGRADVCCADCADAPNIRASTRDIWTAPKHAATEAFKYMLLKCNETSDDCHYTEL